KEVVMHEVGHTLGLRHNFKASAWKSLEEINKMPIDSDEATVASVMDYSPANISPNKDKQGPYYSATIGPYDYWAIEYGYKTDADEDDLKKIASRGGEKGLDYATDEDTRSSDSDPLTNRFDLGQNPVNFARQQMEHSNKLMDKILERSVKDGDGYQRARQAFGLLLSEYWRSAAYAARFPGGVLVHRDHKGDPKQRAPFEVVDANQQREAVKLLSETAFGTPEYSPELLNHLAASRWSHWGMSSLSRLDYPIHDIVTMMQSQLLSQLLSGRTLTRLHDSELKVANEADVYTLAEHMRTVVNAAFTEWQKPTAGEYTARKPYISSFRRALQRLAVKQLASFVESGFSVPEDARTLARMHLATLDGQITTLLKNPKVKLDDYSKAHLLDSQRRIKQVLNAELEVRSID
ncbi:MAG: zinc-dependent metalloprotease, partial [Planctomycetaceae bacterium]|nr:zinc-dependent metalloprotease [Planctomycetaceae bacterium]